MSQVQKTTDREAEEQSSTILCDTCGNEMPTLAACCGVCGESLQEEPTIIANVVKIRDKQSRPWKWPVVVMLSAAAASLAASYIPGTPLSLLIVMWFLFVCPGMILVRFLRLNEPSVEWVLGPTLSFAVDGIVAGILIYTGYWTATRTLAIVVAISVVAALAQLLIAYPAARQSRDALHYARPRSRKSALALASGASVLLFIAAIVAAYTWSPVYTALNPKPPHASALRIQAIATPTPHPTLPPRVDVVFVMDNVNLIGSYDPRGNRYTAAQVLINLVPLGTQVGIIRITSTHTPVILFHLEAILTGSDKQAIDAKFSSKTFGPVDPSPVAYFTPALQTAAAMLQKLPTSDRRYVIVMTDALAYSGDQNICPASPDASHKWFCEANSIENQGIPVILLAFSPGNTTLLAPTKKDIEAHGGTVLPLTDNVNPQQYLTPIYKDMLTGIRPAL